LISRQSYWSFKGNVNLTRNLRVMLLIDLEHLFQRQCRSNSKFAFAGFENFWREQNVSAKI